jgi:hypothetical protein
MDDLAGIGHYVVDDVASIGTRVVVDVVASDGTSTHVLEGEVVASTLRHTTVWWMMRRASVHYVDGDLASTGTRQVCAG